jgi:hypothetical protein
MAKFGGKQPGAGRPIGSIKKPRLSDYLSEEQVKKLVKKALDMAGEGNETMLKFILEQHFGKAIQPIGGEDGGPIQVTVIKYAK